MNISHTVQPEENGSRFDVLLAKLFTERSRSQLQKLIKQGVIRLNGKKVTPHFAVETGDVIESSVDLESVIERPTSLKPRPDIAINVIHDEESFAVVEKPAGLLMHPTVRAETETLAAAVLARWPEIAAVGESFERPGIMQRLDKEASGLVVIAKTPAAYDSLKKQFQEHTIEKEYSVLAHGHTPKDSGTIDLAIGRAASGDKMAARSEPMEGDRPAVTHYRVEQYYTNSALLAVRTETGRTHQIRAHLKALGNPIVGDTLYHPKLGMGFKTASPRLFLHARLLAFTNPATGVRVEFHSPLPADLQEVLQPLKKSK
ncbi:MAG: RluA family pseudouridine synthase [Patescibacteria group bacterium]|jgi:23S rRNA pseudouridine1911/1915/1917 synthase